MTRAGQQEQVDYIWRSSFQYELDNELHQSLREGALLATQTTLEGPWPKN